jgi:hypothetical protein
MPVRFASPNNRVLCLFINSATGARAVLTQAELQSGLSQFTQINGWYHHWLKQFVFSDGVKWLSDQCNGRGLLTDIAFYQLRIRRDHLQLEAFQIWHLQRLSETRVSLACCKVTHQTPIIQTDVEAPQFALSEITLWLINGMLLLPSEYSGTQAQSRMLNVQI